MVVPFTESSSVRGRKSLLKDDSLQQERQISVDPISIKEPVSKEGGHHGNPSFLLPQLKPGKFLSTSLPGSATSSPRFSGPSQKKWKNHSPTLQPSSSSLGAMIDPISGQQSLALSRLAQLQEIHVKRSKSCNEGRNTSSSIDLEMCARKVTMKSGSSHVDEVYFATPGEEMQKAGTGNLEGPEKFKCCLFLPGFGKAKPVRQQNKDDDSISIAMRKPVINEEQVMTEMTISKRVSSNEKQAMTELTISKRVSLEKFECGSWRTSTVMIEGDEYLADGDSQFFDLPMELIRNSDDDETPVSTAFVFDGDLKGVLKKVVVGGGNDNRKSVESGSRHVRFSDVSPTICVQPRLSQKGRESFNSFLEVQTT